MIQNNQVALKKFSEEDRDFYTRIYTDKALMKHITKPLDKADCHRCFDLVLKRMDDKDFTLNMYVILDKKTTDKVGMISLRPIADAMHLCEIGVIILKPYQRQGLAHSAKSLLIKTAFKDSKTVKIIAICDGLNTAANQANMKLGFKKENEFLDRNDNITKIKWQITQQDIQ